LSKFFTRTETGYRISKHIRENCIFARHDLIKDPPFSELDLVSCRNVLIYLDTPAQRVLPALHHSLKPDGLLLLGSAESIGNRTDLFTFGNRNHAQRNFAGFAATFEANAGFLHRLHLLSRGIDRLAEGKQNAGVRDPQ
jgi:chemotaxis methyl-accepting protein methylase